MQNYLDVALQYHEAGFRVIPISESKTPLVKWKEYQDAQSEADLMQIFSKDCHGIGILTGIAGLECIDIDCKYAVNGQALEVDFMHLLDDTKAIGLLDLTVVRTRSGGYHVLYRTKIPSGNTKLALRNATPEEILNSPGERIKVLFETRGVGGYIAAFPTPGYDLQNRDMFNIPEVSNTQRNVLLTVAKTFNEVIEEYEKAKDIDSPVEFEGKPCWEDYNERANALDLLADAGWREVRQIGERVYLRRPGKKDGWSGDYHAGKRLFKSWSTSTEFQAEKAYTPFGVYKILQHRGNSSEAARALYREGFGDRKTAGTKPVAVAAKEETSDAELRKKIFASQFDFNKKPKDIDFILKAIVGGVEYKVGGFGMIGLVTGMEKSRKTTFLKALVASTLSGGERRINFELNLKGKKAIYIDTEQPGYFFWSTQAHAHKLAGLGGNVPDYKAYGWRGFTVKERVAGIDLLVRETENLGLLVIDGALDMVKNFNNEEQSQEFGQKLLEWTDMSGAMVLVVLHVSKSTGMTKGHLGAILNNKCDFSFEMKLNEETSNTHVKHRLSRTKPFQGFEFTQDDEGYPILPGQNFAEILKPKSLPTPHWTSLNESDPFDLEPSVRNDNIPF